MTSFVAFAIDINGTALARYNLAATEEELAKQEARQYLEQHPVIEVYCAPNATFAAQAEPPFVPTTGGRAPVFGAAWLQEAVGL
jgi:hypothetical protein